MPRMPGKNRGELAVFEPMFQQLETFFGYMPNDYLTMGHRPEIMKAVAELTSAVVFTPGVTSMRLRLLVSYVSSRAAQCMYCSAHCGTLAEQSGVSSDQLNQIFAYETSALFSPLERAALRVADKASRRPNLVTDADFAELREYIGDKGCAEILGVISLMGFYNRWNDTVATTLEQPPFDRAQMLLSRDGWRAGKHAPVS